MRAIDQLKLIVQKYPKGGFILVVGSAILAGLAVGLLV